MKTIGVVTVGRSDYGIYRPVLRAIENAQDLNLQLFVTGMHLSPEFGMTVREIEHDDFSIVARVEMLLSSDTPEGIAKSMGLGTIGLAQAYARSRPDLLLVLGDRFEMYAAVVAALPFNIPIAHIHGGELTEGAIDNAIRHAITKMSHLHFVSTDIYAQRVIQMGEEPWRVVVSGAPGLDNLHQLVLLDRDELERSCGFDMTDPILLITYHPVTLEYENTKEHVQALLSALEEIEATLVFTCPNADTQGRLVIQMIRDFTKTHSRAYFIANLGVHRYFSMLKYATAMVGNSSSGIIEAPSFNLPVVNIGTRQQGRARGKNVIDVGYTRVDILRGIEKALSAGFRTQLQGSVNLYGNGDAARIIVNKLSQITLGDSLLYKRFQDCS